MNRLSTIGMLVHRIFTVVQPPVNYYISSLTSLTAGDTTNPYSELMRIPSLGLALGVAPDSVPAPHSKSPPPVIANNLNLLSNTQSLNQLLGTYHHKLMLHCVVIKS